MYKPKEQQITKISLMLEYEIDNTLNSLKENKTNINYLQSPLSVSESNSLPVLQSPQNNIKNEDNINDNNNSTLYAYLNNSSTDSNNSCISTVTKAKKRWNILAKVLRQGSLEEETLTSDEGDDIESVRRFKSFDILHQNSFEDYSSLNSIGKPENWYTYQIHLNGKEFIANIHHLSRHLTASDLMGYNNTGNICVWPSEEALTVYVLSDLDIFRGKWILELGGGMTCLSGVFLAKYAKPYVVHLTDGNTLSVENVRRTVCLNDLSCYTKCSILRWENIKERLQIENEKFDFILSADCLFFDDVRSALVETIWFYLSPRGIALVIAPERGKTMSRFIKECSIKGFQCQKIYKYNEVIWQKHLDLQHSEHYNEDIHYPILIKLTKYKADYWKSNERKYCDFCKCWITDNKASVSFHENGKRHKAAVANKISEICRNSTKLEREKNKFDQDFRKMEEGALKSYAKDLSTKRDLAEQNFNRTKQSSGQIDPVRLPVDVLYDNEYKDSKEWKKQNSEQTEKESLWVEGKSDEGYTYYWNVKSHDSVWEPPKEGFMTLKEYEKIEQIAKEQRELKLSLEADNFRQNVDEEVARYNREKLKKYRKPIKDSEKQKEEEEKNNYATQEEATTSKIGSWEVVEKTKTELVDLELPKINQKWIPSVVTLNTHEQPITKRFKEKTIESLEPSLTVGIPISFNKRKVPKGSVRQRLNDE